MIKQELKTIVDKNLEYVKEQYEANNGNFFPTLALHVTKENGTPVVVMCILGSEANENRYEVLRHLGFKVGVAVKNKEIKNVDALFMLSEAWISKPEIKKDASEKEIEEALKNVLPPSEDPNHSECLMSIGTSDAGDIYHNMYEIKKVWTGDKVTVELKDMNEFLETKGLKSDDGPTKAESPLLDMFWNSFRVILANYDQMPENLKAMAKQLNFLKEHETRSN